MILNRWNKTTVLLTIVFVGQVVYLMRETRDAFWGGKGFVLKNNNDQ